MLTSSGSPKDYQTWLWIGTAITDSSAGSDTLKVLINRWPPADAAAPKEFNLKPAVRKGRALPHSRRQSRDFFTPSLARERPPLGVQSLASSWQANRDCRSMEKSVAIMNPGPRRPA